MERLKQRHTLLLKALESLKKVLDIMSPITPASKNYAEFRDSAIQRFEYSVDTFWKFMREYLEKKYGTTTVASPKPVIKVCVDLKIIDQKHYKTFIKMINDRNLTSHAYNEELAQAISDGIQDYYNLLKSTIDTINV